MSLDKELKELESKAAKHFQVLSKQHEFEEKLQENFPKKYSENMAAFKKYLPDVYKQFKNHPKNKIKLTCTKTGVANIFDHKSNTYLYNDDPISQCRDQVDNQIKNPQFTALSFTKDEAENGFIHTKYMNKLNDTFLKASEELESIKTMPNHLSSMIIFGIGLGYHLSHLLEDVTIDHLYLCEPNNDWFYASLYTADWKYVLEAIDERDGSIYFYLGSSYLEFTNDFIDNLKDKGSFNSVNAVLYQHYPSEELKKLIKTFSEDFHRCAIGWGFYDDGIISLAHDFANGKKQTPLLKKEIKLPKEFSDIPVFVIANGPSLDSAIETIKQLQDQVLVISCGSALQPLLKNGIIPDFNVANERTKNTYHYLDQFFDRDVLKNINFLTTNIMHPDCTDLFKWTGMSLKPAEPATVITGEYIDQNVSFNQLMFSNPVVGNTGTSFSCHMGFTEMYLFGLDFGYEDPSHHHSKDSVYYTDDKDEVENLSKLVRKGEIEIEGNFTEKVYSTTFFNVGKCAAESLLARFPQVNTYNCSKGAKIKGAYPTRLEHVMISNKKLDKEKLIHFIKSELFIERNFNEEEYEYWLDLEKFNHISDKLVDFLDKDFESRAELATALKLQARYLFSYSHTRYRHIYFLLQGSLTYVQSMFRMLMYSFEDEQASLLYVHEAISTFKSFMEEVKDKYQHVLDEVSEHETEVIKFMKESKNK
jgi:hypothetical protein